MKWFRRYRTHFFVILSGLAVLAAFAYLFQPQGHIPPFDANRWRLAESDLEGYCAGVVVTSTGQRTRNPGMAASCRAENAASHDPELDIESAITGFCAAISEGMGMTVEECRSIVAQNKIWPLYDGGFTTDWNETFPYPGDKSLTRVPPDDRVGERDTIEREDGEQER